MIRSFKCKKTEALFQDKLVKNFKTIEKAARRKLLLLHMSKNLEDLRSPPNNRLEGLKGNRKGQFSIRINSQFRICFEWDGKDSWSVEIIDYH